MIGGRLIEWVEGLEVNQPSCRDFCPGGVRHSLADINKAQSLVRYAPSHRIAEGLDEEMDCYVRSLTQFVKYGNIDFN